MIPTLPDLKHKRIVKNEKIVGAPKKSVKLIIISWDCPLFSAPAYFSLNRTIQGIHELMGIGGQFTSP